MKTLKILSLLCVIFLASSCKQNDWLDWKTQNELWLIENAKRVGVETTPTGLQYKCIYQGVSPESSARPDDAKMVTIAYNGKLINGYEFDSSDAYDGYVSDFVAGFSEGLKKMYQWGIYEFYIPYNLGYGSRPAGAIKAFSTLIFDITLLDVR